MSINYRFNYMLATSLQLIKDPGFSADYSSVLDFNSVEDRDVYFDSKVYKQIESTNPINIRMDQSVANINLTTSFVSYDEIEQCSYCRLIIKGESFWRYYFIMSVEVQSAGVYSINLNRDIWQFCVGKNWSIKNAIMSRGHVDRWNSSSIPILYEFKDSVTSSNKIVKVSTLEDSDNLFFVVRYTTTENSVTVCKTGIAPLIKNVYRESASGVTLFSPYSLFDSYNVEGTDYLICSPYIDTLISGFSPGNFGFNIDPASIVWACVICVSSFTVSKVDGKCEIKNGDNYLTRSNKPLIIGSEDTYGISNQNKFKYGLLEVINQGFIGILEKAISTDSIDVPIKPVNGDDYSPTHEPMLYRDSIISRNIIDNEGNVIITLDDYDFLVKQNTNIDIISVLSSSGIVTRIQSNENESQESVSNVIGMTGVVNPIMLDTLSNAWLTYQITKLQTDKQSLALNQLTNIINMITGTLSAGVSVGSANAISGGNDVSNYVAATSAGTAATDIISGTYNMYAAQKKFEIGQRAIKNQTSNILTMGANQSNIINGFTKLTYVVTKIEDNIYNLLAQQYHRFGYNLNKPIDFVLRSRKFYDYKQLQSGEIIGELNTQTKSELISIFMKGVTIWHMDYATPYDYSKENIERSLI